MLGLIEDLKQTFMDAFSNLGKRLYNTVQDLRSNLYFSNNV